MDLEDSNNSKKPKNSNGRKTYFRIKSAGNARPEKMPSKYRPTQRGFVPRTINQYSKKQQ